MKAGYQGKLRLNIVTFRDTRYLLRGSSQARAARGREGVLPSNYVIPRLFLKNTERLVDDKNAAGQVAMADVLRPV